MALSDEERYEAIAKAEEMLLAAKNRKQVAAVFNDKQVGFLVLGYKVIARLFLGWRTDEVIAGKREKKES